MKIAFIGATLLLVASAEGKLAMPGKKQDKSAPHLRHLTGCTPKEIDFNNLSRGEYVGTQYEASLGVTFSASGGFGHKPRVFDTARPFDKAHPGTAEDGDPDLGSPNQHCHPSGPGVGEGGEPGEPGENCKAQGNALIIEESGGNTPDDNQDGGTIAIDFSPPAYIKSMGFLDIDFAAYVTVFDANGGQDRIDLQLLGDNSFQEQFINLGNVKKIEVTFKRSGALTFLKLCARDISEPRTGQQGEKGEKGDTGEQGKTVCIALATGSPTGFA